MRLQLLTAGSLYNITSLVSSSPCDRSESLIKRWVIFVYAEIVAKMWGVVT